MKTQNALNTSLLMTLVLVAGAAGGCDKLDDIMDELSDRVRDGGIATDGSSPPPPPACINDGDCRLFSDYCTGCDCRALAVKTPDPVCGGPGAQCFADPCMNKTASCQAGRCVVSPVPAPVPCASSNACADGMFCTTETGTCNRPPGCGPDVGCPAVCYGTCQTREATGNGDACGPKKCAAGMVCCNESCGICTAPGGACTQQFCG